MNRLMRKVLTRIDFRTLIKLALMVGPVNQIEERINQTSKALEEKIVEAFETILRERAEDYEDRSIYRFLDDVFKKEDV